MTPILKKMNFKNNKEILIVGSPSSFESEILAMSAFTNIKRTIEENTTIEFAIAFASEQKVLTTMINSILPHVSEDAILWFAYPKQSSKKYVCDFDRDTGWTILGQAGWDGVRIVGVDEEWSALRFRQVGFVKTMIRKFAISEEGKTKSRPKN